MDDFEKLCEEFTARFGGAIVTVEPGALLIYTNRGRDHCLDAPVADFLTVMKASLKQGKNLLESTFPTVNLDPMPGAVY